MKRLALASILISVAAYSACSPEDPTPPGGTGGTGVGGAAPTGGSAPTGGTDSGGTAPTGGANTGGAAPTGGTDTGGAAPTGGTGGAPTGGTAGAAPTGGTAGDTGMGGMGLIGGMGAMGGSGAMGGMGMGGMLMGGRGGMGMGGMGGGGCTECNSVATVLDGATILMPCGQNTETRVCIPREDTSTPCDPPPASATGGVNTMNSYAGTHSHNEQLTLGGTPGQMYRITLKVRGMVEGKTYQNGTERSNTGTQVPADGLYTGGVANNSTNGYNIYFIRTDSPMQHYYLNSIAAGNDTRIRHSVFDVDMSVEITAAGGSTICLVSADPNTSAIKNCMEPDNNVCNPVTLQNLDPKIAAKVGNMPYNGQFMGMTVQSVTRM